MAERGPWAQVAVLQERRVVGSWFLCQRRKVRGGGVLERLITQPSGSKGRQGTAQASMNMPEIPSGECMEEFGTLLRLTEVR